MTAFAQAYQLQSILAISQMEIWIKPQFSALKTDVSSQLYVIFYRTSYKVDVISPIDIHALWFI